ncbi:hypothetical protein SAMN06265365_11460 [Tistlia consotensis]|uniref:2OG-Fe(II) oxygenase superfamily protein n=1 Tax=Tistlia consotensis USBA 355 TaxID=560819 RepID=A0A1Y6BE16_9PROT|nr:2OG-Fe(II) oxygenase [Tistlia consotensis]SME99932.1 hypothetical protein SAMN05428998_102303 [Tistlia consotensis USBA 355]SNR76528.1 hypothetical protein SAMN06265365_11460 [Tistlia consotensis]
MTTATMTAAQAAPQSAATPAARRDHFLAALAAAEKGESPYAHWLLSDVLTGDLCDALAALELPEPEAESFDGRRETNNQTRVFLAPGFCAGHAASAATVALFKDPAVVAALGRTCGVDLSKGLLRIEYTRDRDGFWLEPHTDIRAKLFTMLVYLSDDPALADAGTDIYDADKRLVKTAPYGRNLGMIFIPGDDTWHGFSPRPIRGLRRSLIVNYVTPDWRSLHELA